MRGEGPLLSPLDTHLVCVWGGGGVLKLSLFYSVSVHREKIILYHTFCCTLSFTTFAYIKCLILITCMAVALYLFIIFFKYTSLITCNTTHFICIMFRKLAIYTKYFQSNYTFGEILQKTSKFFIMVSAYIE